MVLLCRRFQSLCSDARVLRKVHTAIKKSSRLAMTSPKLFLHPTVVTGLAVAMATPLSVVLRASLASTVAACMSGIVSQKKVRTITLLSFLAF